MERKQEILKPFLWAAVKLIGIWDRFIGSRTIHSAISNDLRILYPGQELQRLQRDFRTKRLGMVLAVACAGGVCSLAVALGSMKCCPQEDGAGIARGDYGESDREVVLEVRYGEYSGQLELAVGARVYSPEEIQQLAEEFMEALPELILQDNQSMEQVVGDLYLAENYEGYPFMVSWYSRNVECLDRSGRLQCKVSRPTTVELELIVSYEDMEWERCLEVTLLPSEHQGTTDQELRAYLMESEQISRHESLWRLPQAWKGKPLEYHIVKEHTALKILILSLLASILVFVLAQKDLHRQYLERQQELKASYPELLHQLTLYLGAGMTIRGSLQNIYDTYQSNRDAKVAPSRVAFEEVGYVCRELATGISEVQAYESWGRRTGLPEYIQLGTLLAQNLQKGSTLLVERLRDEYTNAQKEYLRHCKRIGEEAQTKLLIPLVLMLVVLMLIILIPAFSMAGI